MGKIYQFLLNCSNIYVRNEAETRRSNERIANAIEIPSSKRCCGWLVAVHNGGLYLTIMAIGTPSTNGLAIGVTKGFSPRCTNTSPLTPIWSRLLLTVLFAGLTRVRLAPQKNGGTENQALGRSQGGFSTKIHVAVDALGRVDIYVRRVHNSQMGANRRGEDQASD